MEKVKVDLSHYNNWLSWRNKLGRLVWNCVYIFLFRPFFLNCFNRWRIFLLKIFGADIKKGVVVYSSVKIWAPWNLRMDDYSCFGPGVECYNTGNVFIGKHTTISHRVFLCPGSHDFTDSQFPMIPSDIIIEDQVWVAAEAFIGPRVHIGQGAVVGARACVFKNVDAWTVVGGNPAQFIKKRIIKK